MPRRAKPRMVERSRVGARMRHPSDKGQKIHLFSMHRTNGIDTLWLVTLKEES